MAFQGSLKELPLPDIIQLVSVSGKTGRFTLARDAERGFIFLKNGQMVHAQVGSLIGEEAIYALAIWNHGDFQFAAGEEPDRQTITKSNTNLLMEAARRLDEWRVLSRKISSVDMVPELQVRTNRHEQVTLNPQEWLLVTKIDGGRSIAEIGTAVGISSFDVAKILYGLITSELVQLKKKADAPVAVPKPPAAPPPQAAPAREGGSPAAPAAPARNPDLGNPAAGPVGELLGLADRIRTIAEGYIGEAGHKSIEKYYLLAVAGVRRGEGAAAIRNMIAEFEKATSLLRGAAATEQFRARIAEITTLAS